MAQFSDMIIVNSGLDMIAESQAGGKLIFTKAKLGDGQVGETNIQTLTDIISPKLTVNLSNVTKKEAGHVEVRFTVDNTNLNVGFFAREVGIYAKIGEDGTEKLYGYANAGNYTDYLPDKTTPIDAMTVVIDVVVGNASEIGFETDKTLVYLTLADMDDHNADPNAHNDKIASQTEAEAQSGQNNTKFMTPLRVYQAIVAYFTQFLAAAVFTGIVKAVAPAANSNDNSVPTTSWVRTCFESMAKTVAEILEIQWKAEATGYLLLGPYLGNLKILWGVTVITVAAYPQTIILPATINTYLSGSATPWTIDIPSIVVVPYLCNATTSSVDIILDYEVGAQVPNNVPVIYIALAK